LFGPREPEQPKFDQAEWDRLHPPPPEKIPYTAATVDAGPADRVDSTYQWSLPLPPEGHDRRAYLWLPPQCKRVRGIVFGMQNLMQRQMFEDADFRDALSSMDLGIVFITPAALWAKPGDKEDPALSAGFKDVKAGVDQLHQLMSDL